MSVGRNQAHIAAPTLPNSRFRRVPGAGHDVLPWPPRGWKAMAGLLNDPARYDTGCVDTTTPTSHALR